jgi:uncharacterized membrane protein YgdD (TMEM256/DUF423 family)
MANWIAIGAANAFVAVAAGAFGAHGLKARVSPELVATFQTGAQYHMYHSLALIAVGLFALLRPQTNTGAPAWLFQAGIVLFSGSLYALTLSGVRALGAITPIGGLCFLAAWAMLAYAALK